MTSLCQFFRNLRLRTKLGGSYALLVLLIALCTVISWMGLAKVDQHADTLTRELVVTAEEMSGQAAQLQQVMGFFKVGAMV
ncbi:hypothetical protein [Rhodoferax saidenbachensis]|uniref:Membrane protein n=1 Tax=Rhodoferax saidenbachensis TaxID=1484693 RepID=A0ABU1ZSW0_9BURK|nr:hypothetical protein [Rhodoferax saidenbachensis]MDR7308652.1 putative membrane protein [Rhodoferax saidenbachensis]